jgi:hypothetical protein
VCPPGAPNILVGSAKTLSLRNSNNSITKKAKTRMYSMLRPWGPGCRSGGLGWVKCWVVRPGGLTSRGKFYLVSYSTPNNNKIVLLPPSDCSSTLLHRSHPDRRPSYRPLEPSRAPSCSDRASTGYEPSASLRFIESTTTPYLQSVVKMERALLKSGLIKCGMSSSPAVSGTSCWASSSDHGSPQFPSLHRQQLQLPVVLSASSDGQRNDT